MIVPAEDLGKGKAEKEKGMALGRKAKAFLLHQARKYATEIARSRGEVTADDVRAAMADEGLPGLGMAAGSIFRGPEWVPTGEMKTSAVVANHAREIKVWRLK